MDTETDTSLPGVHCRHCGDVHPSSFSHCPKTGHSLTSGRALIGRVVANRYKVLALIEEGGMGAVYVAEHLLIGRKVALKRLHPELTGDEKAIARFQREARAAAATGHEHIVEVLDLGFAEDGAPFLVMEYLRGRSLSKLLRAEVQLEPKRACRIVGQVLQALDAVHGRGIVHRDLKPDNIILTRRQGDPDFAKVVDFGISKVQAEEGETHLDLTRTGVMLGTPFYMSPEQARGVKDLDHRVDLFAAGVMLYECLAGALPFDGENYHQLLQAILSGERTPLDEVRSGLDSSLVRVVHKAISILPEDRYQTAREMIEALVPHGAAEAPVFETDQPHRGMRFPRDRPRPHAETHASTPPPMDTPPVWEFAPTQASAQPIPSQLAKETTGSKGSGRSPAVPRGLAPAPSTMGQSPRRFVAHSSNWQTIAPPRPTKPGRSVISSTSLPHPTGGSSSTSARAASEPRPMVRESSTSYRRSTPPIADGAPSSSRRQRPVGPTDVKGSLILATMELVRQRGPDAIRRVLNRAGNDVGPRIAGVMLPMAWTPLSDFGGLLRAAEREIGTGEGNFAITVGRALAEQELPTTHRLFMQSATATLAVERIPKLFRAYHSGGRVDVSRVSGGYRVRVRELDPDLLTHAMMLSGFYQRLLEMTGGKGVRASVVSCRERGDEATVTVLRWR